MLDWLGEHQALIYALSGGSLLVFIGTLIVVPAMIVRIPANYFAHEHRPHERRGRGLGWWRLAFLAGKNVLGYLFMLAGLAMLVLPGQGLLAIFVGFMLVDFPGKYRAERWLISRRWVRQPVNWLRRKRGHEPLTNDCGNE
ncbi:MAG: hypothetical protein KJZ65_07295 [Phycisphaerales bacterium]|nr:hypothetical protein [Phycisphaerales bacterium]